MLELHAQELLLKYEISISHKKILWIYKNKGTFYLLCVCWAQGQSMKKENIHGDHTKNGVKKHSKTGKTLFKHLFSYIEQYLFSMKYPRWLNEHLVYQIDNIMLFKNIKTGE